MLDMTNYVYRELVRIFIYFFTCDINETKLGAAKNVNLM